MKKLVSMLLAVMMVVSMMTFVSFASAEGFSGEIKIWVADAVVDFTKEQVEAFKAAIRGCHYWVVTMDEDWKGSNVPQAGNPFFMDYGIADSTFRASLRGRMDTITAPELLKAWEAEKDAAPITAAEIDCSQLQYISSAGLRVLLIVQKSGARVRLTGVNDAVWEILETTGFIDIFAVERKGT